MSILPDETARRSNLPWAIVLALTFFACVTPTLPWLEFSNGIEDLNVATVLELHRGEGSWLLPTLEGKPRIEKPPLTAWITATATRTTTISALDDPDPVRRDQAYRRLAFDIRWTALLTGTLTLLATYTLAATVVRDHRVALVAAIVCASNYFLIRFTRFATTDVQLMLWVTLANVFVARCVLNGISWPAALGAGATLGLAFMAKGPVAFVLTLLPAIAYVLIGRPRARFAFAPLAVGVMIMLAIGLWWFVVVALRVPGVIQKWLSETNPAGGERLSGNNLAVYGVIFAFLAPWTAFVIHGCIAHVILLFQSRGAPDRAVLLRACYPTILLLVTVLVMSCFRDRKDRYILPMVPVASVIAAQSAVATLRRIKHALPDWAHWAMLIALAVIPLLGVTTVVKTIDGQRWFTPAFACGASVVAMTIVIVGMLATRRWRFAMLVTPFVLMMFLQFVGIHGYSKSREAHGDMRPLAELIRERHPTAEVYMFRGGGSEKRAPVDLSVYLNRPTVLIPDPATLPRSDRPQVYLQLQRRGTPECEAAPGWTFLHKVRRDRDWYHAFIRRPG